MTGPTGPNTLGGHEAIFGSSDNVYGGQCLGNVANMHDGGKCPKTAGRDFKFTEGPLSAAGGSISNLWAEAGTTVPSKESSTVNVIDETPAGVRTVVMTCTVPAGARTCSNTSAVPIEAGHYLMVRIDTTAPPTRRIISCVILYVTLSSIDFNNEGDLAFTETGRALAFIVLDVCLRIATTLSLPHATTAASAASAACPQLNRAIAVQASRSGGQYQAQVQGRTSKPQGQSPLAVSCKRKGKGMLIAIRPRARGRTLRETAGTNLGIAFANSGNKPAGVHIAFTVR
jgi:hypothetical protein